ncbi:MAG: hypothetical protein ABEJ89_00020 [Haloarculaceae archaeon]
MNLNDWIERKAQRIIEIAHDEGNPMGLDSLEPDDKRDSSPSTKSRHKKSKRNEGAKEAAEMAAEVWDFDRADNATYAMETFLQVLAEMSADGKTARAACRLATDPTGDENRKPVGETLRLYPRNLEPAETVRMYDEISELLMEQIKQYVEFDRPVEAAIDMVSLEAPGDPKKIEETAEDIGEMFEELGDDATGQFVQGVEDEDSDAKCYKFITLNIVGQHFRIPIVVRPVPKGVPYATLVREVYWRARELVSIETVYLDAGFFSADGLWSLNETPSDYVMSVPKNVRFKRWLDTTENEVAVKQDHGVFGPIEGVGRDYAKTNIVAKPSIQNPDKTVLFATNKDVRDEIGLDRRRAVERTEPYSRRGQQEKSYEMIKKFLAPTQSKSFRLHLFYFCFAALAYSMWKLVDFRVKKDVGIEPAADPVIEFVEFLGCMEEYLLRLG